jgi:hypothetical protein
MSKPAEEPDVTSVRDTASVTVSKPVDNKVPRRRRSSSSSRSRSGDVETLTVDPDVMAKAHAILRPGEQIKIVSEHEVMLIPKPHR